MIFVGLDDTDMPDTPGTNKLAFHVAERLAQDYATEWIVRHQLLDDPRVPCTNKNGCVSLALAPIGEPRVADLIELLRRVVAEWSPPGSDPGLCVATAVPDSVIQWGRAAQSELLQKASAIEVAQAAGIPLEPLGGDGGGVIGALAAVGLLATWNSGRIVHCTRLNEAASEKSGIFPIADIYRWGVDDVQMVGDDRRVTAGSIELGKRLRPNLRDGRIVLYVTPGDADGVEWIAQRIVA